ncbi:MAG: hypothetical protein ACLVAV_19015 [Clostridium sp.]
MLPKQFIAERGYEALQRSVYWIRKVDFLMSKHKPFRSVFYYQNKNTKWRYIVKVVFPPLQTVEIGEIIWGVYIPHSIAVISPYKAGKNLSVLPGVVIGKNGEGDRSKTNPTILDNVTIGAESVVAKDVSSNTIVAGNSAQVIKKYNFDKEIWEKTKED